MAMTSTGGGEGLSSDINVTPLIDVLLVLLIIFMITQPLSRKAFDVQVPPEQQTKQKSQPSSQIVLELRSDGSYAINGQPYPLNQLEQAFHQIYDVRPAKLDRKSTRLNSSHGYISYAVFCLKKKKKTSELQSLDYLECSLLLDTQKDNNNYRTIKT